MILPSGRRWLIIMAAIDGLDLDLDLDLNSVQFIKIGKQSSQEHSLKNQSYMNE
jgi:hypothetical protein